MKIALIITARNKSSRLPNKHMLEVNGKKIIEILIERLSDNKNKYLNIIYYSLIKFQEFEQYLMQPLFHRHCQQLSTLKSSFHYL